VPLRGGEADLGNYRTLCDPCHAVETAALHDRLRARKRARAAEGTGDIRASSGGGEVGEGGGGSME
jgi:hypothetical protein